MIDAAHERTARDWNSRFPIGWPCYFQSGPQQVQTETTGRAFAFAGAGPLPPGVYVRVRCCRHAVPISQVRPMVFYMEGGSL